MNESNYRYELDHSLVAIENLHDAGFSVIVNLDQILAQIETEAGPIRGKHILCQGQDGYWDLLVPREKAEPRIYPLSAVSLADAKAKLGELMASGKI